MERKAEAADLEVGDAEPANRSLWLAGAALVIAVVAVAGARYVTAVPGVPHQGALPALDEAENATAARLLRHIRAIASRPHNIEHYDELEKAARYIEAELTALGYQPVPQIYQVEGRAVRNIEATIEPRSRREPRHHRGRRALRLRTATRPGANDNGTGTAAVLELARLLADLRNTADVRIRLVLFVNEEPPYFQTPDMGSLRYAKLLAERGEPSSA